MTHGKPALLREEVGLTPAAVADRVAQAVLEPSLACGARRSYQRARLVSASSRSASAVSRLITASTSARSTTSTGECM